MPVRKYNLVDVYTEGKKVKKYHCDETDEYLEVKGKEPVIYFDTEKNKILKGKELDEYIRDLSEEGFEEDEYDEDLEIDNEIDKLNKKAKPGKTDDNLEKNSLNSLRNQFDLHLDEKEEESKSKLFDVNVMFNIPKTLNDTGYTTEEARITDKYNTIFENINMCDFDNIVNGMHLNKGVRYQDQKIDQKMFNRAVEYTYIENRHGHKIEDGDISYVGISSLYNAFLINMGFKFFLANDSDLTFKDKLAKQNEVKQRKEEYRESVEQEAYEKGLDEDQANEYIENKMNEYGRRYENLIYNSQIQRSFLNESDYEERAKVDVNQGLINPNDETPLIEASKLGVLAGLLGYGDPKRAFTQFLDPVALKNNEYKFNDKAIDAFIKDIKISEKDRENMVYGAFDHSTFFDKFAAITEPKDKKTLSFEEAVAYGKELSGNPKHTTHSDKFFADLADDAKKVEAQVDKNKDVLKVAKLYNDMKFLRSKKPWYYVIAHPMKAYMENKVKKDMLNYIKANTIKGTDFEKSINDYVNCKVKDQNKYYDKANDLAIKDPEETNAYDKVDIQYTTVKNSTKYQEATYSNEEYAKKGELDYIQDSKEKEHDRMLMDVEELDENNLVDEQEVEQENPAKERYEVNESDKQFDIKKPEIKEGERFEVSDEIDPLHK